MYKFNVFVAFIVVLTVSNMEAATYKGQKIYIESCKECHGGGQELAASKTQRNWGKILDKKGERLADIHLNSKKAQPSWSYFTDKSFTKGARHLEDFLVEYASDSGNVPACN